MKNQSYQEFRKLMDEYHKDIQEFGFHSRHDIDFSGVGNKKIKYLCGAMRNYEENEE